MVFTSTLWEEAGDVCCLATSRSALLGGARGAAGRRGRGLGLQTRLPGSGNGGDKAAVPPRHPDPLTRTATWGRQGRGWEVQTAGLTQENKKV